MSDESQGSTHSSDAEGLLKFFKALGLDGPRSEGKDEVTGVATFVRPVFGWKGRVGIYRLSPPIKADEGKTWEYVFVSAVSVLGEPETYIFAADGPDAEKPINYTELPGSYRGGLSHTEALKRAGYAIEGGSKEEATHG